MRLRTVTAPDARQAMARLRALLGADAIIVATQQVDGGVRITGAVDNDEIDLGDLLAAPETLPCVERLARVAAHHELPPGMRERLLDAVREHRSPDPSAALGHALHRLYRFAPLPQAARLLLTGPPGAGKTASLAKLAARAVLAGRTVAVLSTDVARAGGIEQLRALLAPLQLEPQAVPEPRRLELLVGAAGAELVLIDSPGINPFRPADLGRLSQCLETSGALPVLVLDAATGSADCAELAQTFAALGIRWLLATKLDVARRLGGVLAAADAGLALAEAGIGPTIGRGLAALTPAGLARLLLRGVPGIDLPKPCPAACDLGKSSA
jgi:flagellar biosynthesis protein FlhF